MIVLAILISALISGFVGYLVDRASGFWWGFFLGPIGWLLAAVLKTKERDFGSAQNFMPRTQDATVGALGMRAGAVQDEKTDAYDIRKWTVLKEIDPEICSAANEVKAIDPRLEAVLAEKYMLIGEKVYLDQIVRTIRDNHAESRKRQLAQKEELEAKYSEAGARAIQDYEQSLAKGRIDPTYGASVSEVQIYNGSWVGWRGGLLVFFEDGRVLLRNGSLTRLFGAGDEGWR